MDNTALTAWYTKRYFHILLTRNRLYCISPTDFSSISTTSAFHILKKSSSHSLFVFAFMYFNTLLTLLSLQIQLKIADKNHVSCLLTTAHFNPAISFLYFLPVLHWQKVRHHWSVRWCYPSKILFHSLFIQVVEYSYIHLLDINTEEDNILQKIIWIVILDLNFDSGEAVQPNNFCMQWQLSLYLRHHLLLLGSLLKGYGMLLW